MKNLISRESEKQPAFGWMKSRLFVAAMCFISITCACIAQDMAVAEVSTPSPHDLTEAPVAHTAAVFDFSLAQAQQVNILAEMKANYPHLYSRYNSGRRMKTTGWILTGTGIGAFVVAVGAIAAAVEEDDDELGAIGAVSLVAGIGLVGAGIPILCVGGAKKRGAVREFNRQYNSSQLQSPHFQINLYPKRVGLAYVF
jgi:hypothetical protein